jgi:DNA-binding MarR family transcriptional regulator/N-acetylglutamate synthase-like GNAT family acetyltransferase
MPVSAHVRPPSPPDAIERVRRFNRFYTRRIGVLHEGLLHSPYSLTESRVLWELAHHDGVTAGQLGAALDLDQGYLSRILRRFRQRGLLRAERSRRDGRVVHLGLTAAGRRAFAPLDAASRAEVGGLLGALPGQASLELLQAMGTIERLLDDGPERAARIPTLLRPPRAGDLGWVVARHGALYAEAYRWDGSFEALVARIVADYADRLEPAREACWIAERDGANVGCVFLVQARDEQTGAAEAEVAQLRLLLVEPAARRLGLGGRLIDECTRFARAAGYRHLRLWTNSVLAAARHLYEKAGYRLVSSAPHHSFGHDLVGETWELPLR